MEQKQVTANYLVTKDDLFQFAIAAMKDQDNKVERWCCRLIGLAMVIFGISRGEMNVVFTKAINICMECIGIG